MILMQGKGVSKGVASGPIYFFQRPDTTISDAPAADIEAEKARITQAQEKSIDQLNALADKAREETGDETAILFETHAMFVEDEDYVDCMMNALEERHCTAEKAVETPARSSPPCWPPWTTPTCRAGPPTSRMSPAASSTT